MAGWYALEGGMTTRRAHPPKMRDRQFPENAPVEVTAFPMLGNRAVQRKPCPLCQRTRGLYWSFAASSRHRRWRVSCRRALRRVSSQERMKNVQQGRPMSLDRDGQHMAGYDTTRSQGARTASHPAHHALATVSHGTPGCPVRTVGACPRGVACCACSESLA
jgi:hypothetical protein